MNVNNNTKLLVMLGAAGAVILAVVVLTANQPNGTAPKTEPVETPEEINVSEPVIVGKKKRHDGASVAPQPVAPNATTIGVPSESLSTQRHEGDDGTTPDIAPSVQESSA